MPNSAYSKTAIHGAGSVRLAIVLYEQIIQDISRADDALAHRRSEQCATEISHALAVIGYLQATVCQNGTRDVIRNSDGFYTNLQENLIEAKVRSSRQILARLQPQLMELREAWIKLVGGV
jgi:flagellar biosynthetic protein FliS